MIAPFLSGSHIYVRSRRLPSVTRINPHFVSADMNTTWTAVNLRICEYPLHHKGVATHAADTAKISERVAFVQKLRQVVTRRLNTAMIQRRVRMSWMKYNSAIDASGISEASTVVIHKVIWTIV
jgi:hypothetical protein